MKYPMLILVLALVGCDSTPHPDWSRAQLDYVCSIDQMTKAQSESTYCTKNTSYLGSYCYDAAIIRNCSLKEKLK